MLADFDPGTLSGFLVGMLFAAIVLVCTIGSIILFAFRKPEFRPLCGVCGHVRALNWETCLPVPKRCHATALHIAKPSSGWQRTRDYHQAGARRSRRFSLAMPAGLARQLPPFVHEAV